MDNVWSQELSICQGVQYTDMPWRYVKSEEPVLFVCTRLGNEFFNVRGSDKLKIYTQYRIMFLGDTWEKKIQIFNKSYFLQPRRIEKTEITLDTCLVTYGKEYNPGSIFIMDDGRLYCTKENSERCIEMIRSIYDIETIEYSKFQR